MTAGFLACFAAVPPGPTSSRKPTVHRAAPLAFPVLPEPPSCLCCHHHSEETSMRFGLIIRGQYPQGDDMRLREDLHAARRALADAEYQRPMMLVHFAGSPTPFPPVGHSTSWRAKARHPRLSRMQPGKGVDGGPSPAMTESGPQARLGTESPLPARCTSAPRHRFCGVLAPRLARRRGRSAGVGTPQKQRLGAPGKKANETIALRVAHYLWCRSHAVCTERGRAVGRWAPAGRQSGCGGAPWQAGAAGGWQIYRRGS